MALLSTVRPADAVEGQVGAQQVTLNPGGGIEANGSDGLRFTINSAQDLSYGAPNFAYVHGQDGVVYRGTFQYCCSAGAPMLNIGGTLYGQAGPAYDSGVASWSSIEIMATSGATSTGARTATTGNSTATVRYTVERSGRTYTMDRHMSYTYPNDFVTDTYTFTIPDGNTDAVKFYIGGDTAPGSSDQGYGIMLTSPVRSVISLNTSSQIMYGFREVAGSKTFDGATSQGFSTPYPTVRNGQDIGYVVQGFNHDAGLMMQWNLGSTPGVQTASFQQFATQQGTNLNAEFSASSSEIGVAKQLNLSAVNTLLTSATGLAYTFTLPSGLVVASGAPTNACGGTLTATPGTDTVTLSGGSVGAATNCVMSVGVVSSAKGTYTIAASSVSGLSALTNNVGTSSLTFTNDNDSDGIDDAIEAAGPNGGDANDDGTPDAEQLNVASFVNALTDSYTAIAVDEACELSDVSIKSSSDFGVSDSGYAYPLGLLDFTADCGTPGFETTVTQYFYDPPVDEFVLRKFANGSFQTVDGATITMETIGGRSVLVIAYQVLDGGPLDDDGLENGIIVDPAGPATLATTLSVGAPNTGIGPVVSLVTYSLLPGLATAIAIALAGAGTYKLFRRR